MLLVKLLKGQITNQCFLGLSWVCIANRIHEENHLGKMNEWKNTEKSLTGTFFCLDGADMSAVYNLEKQTYFCEVELSELLNVTW